MRFVWRPLRAGELDHELLWLCVTIAGAALMWCWLALALPWPRCTFHALTGLPCVTCGATRAALSLLQADPAAAWRFNPLATIAICGIGVFDAYAAVVLATRARRLRVRLSSPAPRRALLATVATVALVNWGYLLLAR
jgi:hypothetical protein